jgi:tetratricopeptide (TPR) repeat protein
VCFSESLAFVTDPPAMRFCSVVKRVWILCQVSRVGKMVLKKVALVAIPYMVAMPCYSQGIIDAGAAQSAALGLGAGLSASASHGRVVTRSYESMLQAQQVAMAQTRAIEQYMKLGCQFEAKKQWDNAEKSYQYVLKVVALRDGPGSPKAVPALQHLVTVNRELNNLPEAINFQERVLAFAKRASVQDYQATLSAQLNLSDLLIRKSDFERAAPVLSESVALCNANPSIPTKRRRAALKTYATVLRKLHKDADAEAIEAQAAADDQSASETAVSKSPETDSPTPQNIQPTVPQPPQETGEQTAKEVH